MPPEELQDLVGELTAVFTSGRKRAHDSAKALAPNAELIADPLFAEAPLASPRIPILKMKVPKWAVVARILWHAGYHPEIENYRKAKHRAAQAADILMHRARAEGVAASWPTAISISSSAANFASAASRNPARTRRNSGMR